MEALNIVDSKVRLEMHGLPSFDIETRWNSTWRMEKESLSREWGFKELLLKTLERLDGSSDHTSAPTCHLASEILED